MNDKEKQALKKALLDLIVTSSNPLTIGANLVVVDEVVKEARVIQRDLQALADRNPLATKPFED
jgi:hypothetical protein